MATSSNLTVGAELTPLARPVMLADGVYDSLRAWLISGGIQPDERIKIDVVAKRLGVSNTPIRQALGRLEADGLVYQEPHRGFIAANLLDTANIHEIYDLRSMIEPLAAGRVAETRSAADIERLRQILSEVHDGDRNTFVNSDESFHLLIATLAGNRIAVEVLERLFTRSRAYRNMYTLSDASAVTDDEHNAVVEAIETGDAAAANSAMSHHLIAASTRITQVTNLHIR